MLIAENLYVDKLQPVSGIENFLKKTNFRNLIGSNNIKNRIIVGLKKIKLKNYFPDDSIFSFDLVGRSKPEPDIHLKAIKDLEISGFLIGDISYISKSDLLENTVYDQDNGQLLSGSFMDYAIPRADDLTNIDIEWNMAPCKTNPLKTKGAGEAGAIGAPPAIINALVNALTEYNIDHIEMPATANKLWSIIKSN